MLPPAIEHHNVPAAGVRLHVAATGPKSGRPLLFLHGFPEYWAEWRNQLSYFAAKGFRAIAPDQRGYNDSDKPQALSAFNVDRLVDDVLALIEWSGHKSACVVAHDWGAAVAWWLALREPQCVEKLAIINVPHPAVMNHHLRSNPRQMARSWYAAAMQLPALPELAMRAGGFRLLKRALRRSSNPGTFSEEDLAAYAQAWSRPGALSAMVNWYRAALRFPAKPIRRMQVRPQTLVIWGAGDRFLGREMAAESAAMCESGRLEIIEDATHWVVHERPDRVNELLHRFFS